MDSVQYNLQCLENVMDNKKRVEMAHLDQFPFFSKTVIRRRLMYMCKKVLRMRKRVNNNAITHFYLLLFLLILDRFP